MSADDPQLCGAAEIADGRWILWSLEWSPSISHCILTLNEKWFSKDLPNGFVRISFDELYHEHPPSIFIDAMISETSSISICIAHFNGAIQKLVLRTSDTSSILAPLIALIDDDSSLGPLKMSSILNSNSSSAKMTSATCGIIKNRIVSCIYWPSSQSVFFGLRGGDTLLAGLQDEGRGQGLSVVEYLLRDTAFLQVLWDGIMQTDNFERATLALCSVEIGRKSDQSLATRAVRDNMVMAVSSEGVLRVWSTKSKKCVLQISLGQLLSEWLMFDTLEDAKITACLNPKEDILQISIGINIRNRIGGEKEWHIAMLEISVTDITASVAGSEGRLRVASLLSPPVCPSPHTQDMPRNLSPTLLDLQLYPSHSSSVVMAAWRWSWIGSDGVGEVGTITQNALASHVLPPNPSVSVSRGSMRVVDDGVVASSRQQLHSKEDSAVCGLLTGSSVQHLDLQLSLKNIKCAMIQRVFLPERISLRVIASVLASGVPAACRYDIGSHSRTAHTRDNTQMLGACVHGVVECCTRWGDIIYTDMGGVPVPSQELEAQAKAYLLFIDLCERRTQSIEGYTVGCLQRSVHRAPPPSSSSSSSSTSSAVSHSVAVGASRRSLELTFVLIPTRDKVDTPNSPVCTPTYYQAAGSAALQLVESAIEANHEQAVKSDMRLQQTFQSNAVLNFSNLSWVKESISDLAAAAQSVTPGVLHLMQSSTPPEGSNRVDSARAWISTHFGDIEGSFKGSLCSYDEPSLTLEKFRATSQQHSTSQPSCDFLRAVSGMAGSEIRENYCKARSKAVLLTLLSSSGASVHSSLSSFIVTNVLPHALFSMVYWGLLLWLNTVRCSDSTASLGSADFFDLFVLSPQDDQSALRTLHIPSSSRVSVWDAFCAYSMSSADSTLSTPAIEGNMRHACAQLQKESRPSPTNALLSYLTRATQHSAVSRVSSVLLWGAQYAGKGVVESSACGSTIQSLADAVVKGRLHSSVAVASFLECFRQMLRGRINTGGEEGSVALSERMSKDILLTQMLDSCLEDLIIAVASPPSHSILDMTDADDMMDTVDSDDFNLQLVQGLNRHSQVSPGHLDSSLLCLRDRLAVLYKSSNAIVAGSRTDTGTDNRDVQSQVASFCCRSPDLFLHLHRIAHLTDVVEITKRIRDVTLRPKDSTGICSGAALAIRANYALSDAVDEALRSLIDPSDPQQSEHLAVRLHLSVEQAVCWSRVFEHAVEQHSFDEALGAVLRLVELAHSHDASFALKVEELLKSSGVSGWRVALGSMVFHACSTGRLGWLCSLNDIWARGLHISGAISEEIERLASSGYSSSDGISSPSYYECSCVFALSRQNLQEAARMSVVQVHAVDRQQTAHMIGDLQAGMVAGTAQIRALSVAVTALSVIEPQHAAFVLLRTRTASSSNEKLYDASMGEDEEKGEDLSDDPLSMRSVQQLSVHLQLRVAASMLTNSHPDGSREATALHLAIILEELEASEKPLVDSSSGYSASYNILTRCAGRQCPKGHPSSSWGRAGVIFSMASSAAARHVQMSASSGSSSANHRLQSEYSPQGGRGLKGSATTLHLWTPLLDALALFDTPGLNWALHLAAFEGVLSERILEVPPALVESYRNAGGDLAALLRLLLAHGHLLEACYLATSLIESHRGAKSSKGNKQSQIVPYNVIDEVIIAARRFISLISTAPLTTEDLRVAKERERNALQSQVLKLERAIKQHFILILAAEID